MAIAETSPPLTTEIQPFGALIACGPDLGEITHVSENIETVLGRSPDGLLGAPLASVAPRDLIHEVRNIMSLRHFAEDRHFAGAHDFPMGARDVSVSHSDATNHVVIEFEPPAGSQNSWEDFAAELRHLSAALRASCDDETLLKTMVKWLGLATGYDSAAAYRYAPGGGKIIAEAGHTAQQSLLGERLRYLETLPEARPDASHPILHFTADASLGAARILALDLNGGQGWGVEQGGGHGGLLAWFSEGLACARAAGKAGAASKAAPAVGLTLIQNFRPVAVTGGDVAGDVLLPCRLHGLVVVQVKFAIDNRPRLWVG